MSIFCSLNRRWGHFTQTFDGEHQRRNTAVEGRFNGGQRNTLWWHCSQLLQIRCHWHMHCLGPTRARRHIFIWHNIHFQIQRNVSWKHKSNRFCQGSVLTTWPKLHYQEELPTRWVRQSKGRSFCCCNCLLYTLVSIAGCKWQSMDPTTQRARVEYK